MTYTFTPTTFNPETNQHQTGVNIDGETVRYMCDADKAQSALRARKAAMLMAIEESHDNYLRTIRTRLAYRAKKQAKYHSSLI